MTKLKYKSKILGRAFIPIPAMNTSRTRTQCSHTAPRNRPSQSVFHCLGCGYEQNADVNAAENIRRQGLTNSGQGRRQA